MWGKVVMVQDKPIDVGPPGIPMLHTAQHLIPVEERASQPLAKIVINLGSSSLPDNILGQMNGKGRTGSLAVGR